MTKDNETLDSGLIDYTTEDHYNEFKRISKESGYTNRKFASLYKTKENLLRLFKEDHNLNNIQLKHIDAYYYSFSGEKKNGQRWKSYAMNCCTIKHVLIYNVLGAKPCFMSWEERRKKGLL